MSGLLLESMRLWFAVGAVGSAYVGAGVQVQCKGVLVLEALFGAWIPRVFGLKRKTLNLLELPALENRRHKKTFWSFVSWILTVASTLLLPAYRTVHDSNSTGFRL